MAGGASPLPRVKYPSHTGPWPFWPRSFWPLPLLGFGLVCPFGPQWTSAFLASVLLAFALLGFCLWPFWAPLTRPCRPGPVGHCPFGLWFSWPSWATPAKPFGLALFGPYFFERWTLASLAPVLMRNCFWALALVVLVGHTGPLPFWARFVLS